MAQHEGGQITFGEIRQEWDEFCTRREKNGISKDAEQKIAAAWSRFRKVLYNATINPDKPRQGGKEIHDIPANNKKYAPPEIGLAFQILQKELISIESA